MITNKQIKTKQGLKKDENGKKKYLTEIKYKEELWHMKKWPMTKWLMRWHNKYEILWTMMNNDIFMKKNDIWIWLWH